MLAQKLIVIVQQMLQKESMPQVVQLAVGELLYTETEIQKHWHMLVAQTPLQNTKLNIRIIPAEQQCMVCFLKYHPKQKETACPQCKSVGAKIISGEEFYLDEK